MKTFSAGPIGLPRPSLFVLDVPVAFNRVFSTFEKVRKAVSGNFLLGLRCLAPKFLAVSLLALPLTAASDSSTSKLMVSATVLKHASLRVLVQPPSIHVLAADIQRGYVDVVGPAQVAIQSNTANGYLLMFETQGDFLNHTVVRGLDADVQLGAAGGGVTQRSSGRGMSTTVYDLQFRFALSSSARQGVYAWPLKLSVTPL